MLPVTLLRASVVFTFVSIIGGLTALGAHLNAQEEAASTTVPGSEQGK